jgi:hypothetical protein
LIEEKDCPMKMRRFALVLVVLTSAAFSQVGSGTLITVQDFQDKIIVAADSRTTFPCPIPFVCPHLPKEDNHCKIAAFRHQLVFAIAGAESTMYWNATEEAHVAARTIDMSNKPTAAELANTFADAWAKRMKGDWETLIAISRETVRQMAQTFGPLFDTGYFAATANGHVALTAREIVFHTDDTIHMLPAPAEWNWNCSRHFCPSSPISMDVLDPLRVDMRGDDVPYPLLFPSPETLAMIRVIDLTIEDNPDGDVGGPVDAVELYASGGIRWFHSKANCPENQD